MPTENEPVSIKADLSPEDVQRAFANHILRCVGVKHADISQVNIQTIKDADPEKPPTFRVEIIAANIVR